jgi:hypothetical protein
MKELNNKEISAVSGGRTMRGNGATVAIVGTGLLVVGALGAIAGLIDAIFKSKTRK